jgi:hypothetical protein
MAPSCPGGSGWCRTGLTTLPMAAFAPILGRQRHHTDEPEGGVLQQGAEAVAKVS